MTPVGRREEDRQEVPRRKVPSPCCPGPRGLEKDSTGRDKKGHLGLCPPLSRPTLLPAPRQPHTVAKPSAKSLNSHLPRAAHWPPLTSPYSLKRSPHAPGVPSLTNVSPAGRTSLIPQTAEMSGAHCGQQSPSLGPYPLPCSLGFSSLGNDTVLNSTWSIPYSHSRENLLPSNN